MSHTMETNSPHAAFSPSETAEVWLLFLQAEGLCHSSIITTSAAKQGWRELEAKSIAEGVKIGFL